MRFTKSCKNYTEFPYTNNKILHYLIHDQNQIDNDTATRLLTINKEIIQIVCFHETLSHVYI